MNLAERAAWQAAHDEDFHSMACLANAIVFALGVISLATLIYLT